jgi:hypothetical protein
LNAIALAPNRRGFARGGIFDRWLPRVGQDTGNADPDSSTDGLHDGPQIGFAQKLDQASHRKGGPEANMVPIRKSK